MKLTFTVPALSQTFEWTIKDAAQSQKMKKNLIFTISATAIISAGCSKNEEMSMDNWNGEISLSSGVTVQTRANSSDVPDKQIASGQKVYAYVNDATVNWRSYADTASIPFGVRLRRSLVSRYASG